jgi:hypothetical protein
MDGYPELLRAAIKTAGTSRNKLSSVFAEKTGNQVKSEYRALGKYLSGDEEPSRERAAILAVLLQEHRLALVSDPQGRRQVRLEDIAEGVAEILDNQREALDLLKAVLPVKAARTTGDAPRQTKNSS